MARMRFNKGFNVNRVVKRLVRTVLALYVGGTIMTTFGTVMSCTNSPFYDGLSLIGWTVQDNVNQTQAGCSTWPVSDASTVYNNVITDTSGAGVLAVVGIIAIAQIVTEFVTW